MIRYFLRDVPAQPCEIDGLYICPRGIGTPGCLAFQGAMNNGKPATAWLAPGQKHFATAMKRTITHVALLRRATSPVRKNASGRKKDQ
jgi:hypothetical protein